MRLTPCQLLRRIQKAIRRRLRNFHKLGYLLGNSPDLGQRIELVEIQDILTICAIESLDVSMLRRLTRLDEIKENVMLLSPGFHLLGDQLRAIV